MCGIAGIMTRDGTAPDAAVLDRLARALAHRGPDGEGRSAAGGTALVHRRLAIIDLETGAQPLAGPGGTQIAANGEIYNYRELRAEIGEDAFRTRSDCEPPLHLYGRDRIGFTARLRGMYALAIHDPAEERLVLARDPFGIKPLYYAETARGFAFASEPQALIRAGLVEPRVHVPARGELLQLQFTTGAETIFAGIRRVLPGETVVVAGGRVIERSRAPALPEGGPEEITESEALARLDGGLADSVGMHQRADVPYGMFLSGGIDSSAVLALMARLNATPVLAFTCGFDDPSVADEREAARKVARACGARHVEVGFTARDFWELLPRVAAAMDDPAADYAALPSYKLAEAASREVKVVLVGEGGDELFAGYGRYRSVIRPWWRGRRAMRTRGALDGLGLLREEPRGWRLGIEAAEATQARPWRSALQTAQAVDLADWLPHDLCTKLDRTLMAHGVEGRTPFLDPVVAAAAFRLPDHLKIRGGLGKWLLRRWLETHLPAAEPFAKKRGFTVPAAAWIAKEGKRLGPLVAAAPGIEEICEASAVRKLFTTSGKRAGFACWVLLFYALWHRANILGRAPEGDVFDTLGAAP